MAKPKKKAPLPVNVPLIGLRTLCGYISRSAIAAAAGLAEPTCWRIEVGHKGIRPESLAAYADKLGITLDELDMLRQPENQQRMFHAARVIVLPVDLWRKLDSQSETGTIHSLVAAAVTKALRNVA